MEQTRSAGAAREILILVPAPMREVGGLTVEFKGAREKSLAFAEAYKKVAERRGCVCLDTGTI